MKKLPTWSKLITLIGSLVVLTACSSTGTSAGSNDAAMNGNDNGAAQGVQTSGLGNSGSGDSSSNGLSNPNAMVPGANQRYYFDFNESNVHSSDLPSMKVQAKYLMAHPNIKILITGNTDIRGSREYNIGLGQRRANAVLEALRLDGVSGTQMRTVSYGAEKPIALGNSETDYAMNRNVHLIYPSY